MGSVIRNKASSLGEEKSSSAHSFTFRHLAIATHNFKEANLIGEGGFGRVYKGLLDSSQATLLLPIFRFPFALSVEENLSVILLPNQKPLLTGKKISFARAGGGDQAAKARWASREPRIPGRGSHAGCSTPSQPRQLDRVLR